ncbi:FxLYD domain-containing protein [Halobacterium sp. R2-5]|uniref:FxLYD domain-containing protein n=1 Tax=Halobacterium sp. R2-5 TaxID=2715751 RepID=UPI00141D8976|nr:DUF3426 domain-containing protein [Halobacterium sp. R2-5]
MSVAAASAALAGCTGPGSDESAGAADEADAAAVIVRNAPENPGPYEEGVAPLTNHESEELALENVQFQRAGQKGLVVAGDLTNASDRAFESASVEVTLYDANENQDSILDSASKESTHGELAAGATWQWAATFEEVPEFEIDHYSVAATANYASENG